MENGNGRGKWKQTWKMENLSREMLVFCFFFKMSSTLTKNKRHVQNELEVFKIKRLSYVLPQ